MLKEWVFWHCHTLGIEALSYLGAKWCAFIFQNISYFIINLCWNQKWLVFSYVSVITCILYIRGACTERFLGVEFHSRLLCRDRGLTRCAKEMKGTAWPNFHVPFTLPGEKHQYMKWYLNNLKQSIRKSRITRNRLWSHEAYESLSASSGSHTSYSEPLSEHLLCCAVRLSLPLVCELLAERDFIIFIFVSLDPSTVDWVPQVSSKCLVNEEEGLLLLFGGRRRQ